MTANFDSENDRRKPRKNKWGYIVPDLPGWDSLEAVTRFHRWAEIIGIVVLALLVIAELASYRYGQRKDDLTTQQQETTDKRHDEEMARLHLETAATNERAANLEHENELIRQNNLELEKALEPRLLEQLYSAEALKPFAEIQVFIVSVPDFEARRLASQMAVMFQMAGWTHKVVPSANAEAIIDGVEV
jgi:cell division protein FtsB